MMSVIAIGAKTDLPQRTVGKSASRSSVKPVAKDCNGFKFTDAVINIIAVSVNRVGNEFFGSTRNHLCLFLPCDLIFEA